MSQDRVFLKPFRAADLLALMHELILDTNIKQEEDFQSDSKVNERHSFGSDNLVSPDPALALPEAISPPILKDVS